MYKLKLNSILADENNEKFFGNGPLYLLEGVKKYGSLSASAKAMNMSYSKASKIIKHSEEVLGFKLLESHSGGNKGGSSQLTDKGNIFLNLYREYAGNNKIHGDIHLDDLIIPDNFNRIRIIILASGQGKRFRDNKLLYPLNGKPVIEYILTTLLPLKDICIISTIHKEIADMGEVLGYKTALHKEEKLSDSIRYGISEIETPCTTMFVQGDQPLLTLTSVMNLIKESLKDPDRFYKLGYGDKKAAPTVFPERYFEELRQLEGEQGGSAVVKRHNDTEMVTVQVLFPWEIWDIDEQDDLHYFEDMTGYLGKEVK